MPTPKKTASRIGYIGIIGVCLFIFVLAAWRASSRTLAGWETHLFETIFNWPDVLRWPFLIITQLGSVWLLVVATTITLAKHSLRLATQLLIGGASTYLLVELAKHLVNRPRPMGLLPGVRERELFLTSGPGFPSGHTAMATVVSLMLWPYIPKKYRWLLPVWIVSVGFSRVYLGVHAPLDIIGGFTLGAAMASLVHVVLKPSSK